MSAIKRFLNWHFSDLRQRRSAEQLEAEKTFLWMPWNRYWMMPAAVILQLGVGSFYSWSVYNVPVEKYTGAAEGSAAITFNIFVGFYGYAMAVMGPQIERWGPKKTVMICSVWYWVGMMLSALAVWRKSIGALYVAHGIITAIPMGIMYIAPVSPSQKWFPEIRGVVSGMAVCGTGGGTMISSKLINALIKSYDVPITMMVVGSIYGVLMFVCAFPLRTPPESQYMTETEQKMHGTAGVTTEDKDSVDKSSKAVVGGATPTGPSGYCVDVDGSSPGEPLVLKEPVISMTLIESLKTADFWLMYVMLVCNATCGVLTLSKLADICQKQFGKDSDMASTVVSINSAFNLSGRLLIASLSDILGRKPLFMISLVVQFFLTLFTPTMIMKQTFWPFCVSIWIIQALYGGGFGLIPAFLCDMFGNKNNSSLHGVIISGWATMGVFGGLVYSFIYKAERTKYGATSLQVYNLNYYWICAFIVLGLLVTPFIHTDARDRLFPAVKGQVFNIRLFKRLLRVQYLPHQVETDEWRAYLLTRPENQEYARRKQTENA